MAAHIKQRGFTLVELLVVISIVAILSVIGIVVFTNVQKGTRDARRRADIDAISKAFEVKYNTTGIYGDLTPTLQENQELFASKQFPKDPKGQEYTIIQDSQTKGFRICASLQDNPACSAPSDTCHCKASQQAEPPSATGGSTTTAITNPDAVGPTGTPTIISDDNQTSFWRAEHGNYGRGGALKNMSLSDDTSQKQSGVNSLKLTVGAGTFNVITAIHDYGSARQNWSTYKWVSFYWYGANTNTLLSFLIQTGPDNEPWLHQYSCQFNDNFTGWKQISHYFSSCQKNGTPDLTRVKRLFFLIDTADIPSSAPTSFNWYVDQIQVSP